MACITWIDFTQVLPVCMRRYNQHLLLGCRFNEINDNKNSFTIITNDEEKNDFIEGAWAKKINNFEAIEEFRERKKQKKYQFSESAENSISGFFQLKIP